MVEVRPAAHLSLIVLRRRRTCIPIARLALESLGGDSDDASARVGRAASASSMTASAT